MRACLAFLLATTLLQAAGMMASANVRIDAVPANTQVARQELMGIEKILDILAPVNVRKIDRTTERSFQNFTSWREQTIYKPSAESTKAQGSITRPRSSTQRAY